MPVSVAQQCQYNPVVSTCNSEQSSFENSVAENNLMEEPSYKSLRLEGDMDSQEHVLYKDSHMPISVPGGGNSRWKMIMENPDSNQVAKNFLPCQLVPILYENYLVLLPVSCVVTSAKG
jgi:hypothetical protein